MHAGSSTTIGNVWKKSRTRVLKPTLSTKSSYHAHMLPNGVNNAVVLSQYKIGKGIYPSDAYVVANEREFFAVTASVFLYGKETMEPFTRAKIREKQPEYYNYLVWMFGFDPDQKAGVAPLASAQ